MYHNNLFHKVLDLRNSWCSTTFSPADSEVALNHGFFFLPDLFGLQSVMMDGATKHGVLWASAALKCIGMGLKRWDEWTKRRDEMEGPEGDI